MGYKGAGKHYNIRTGKQICQQRGDKRHAARRSFIPSTVVFEKGSIRAIEYTDDLAVMIAGKCLSAASNITEAGTEWTVKVGNREWSRGQPNQD